MKVFRVLTHPAFMLASVCIIVIAGQTTATLFLHFFVMNLITGNLFAVIGAIGLVLLFWSYMLIDKNRNPFTHHLMNTLGVLFIIASVILGFYWLPWQNCYQSFTHVVPLLTVVLATVSMISFLIDHVHKLTELLQKVI